MENMKMAMPSLKQQKEVVELLDCLQNLTQQQNDICKEYINTINLLKCSNYSRVLEDEINTLVNVQTTIQDSTSHLHRVFQNSLQLVIKEGHNQTI